MNKRSIIALIGALITAMIVAFMLQSRLDEKVETKIVQENTVEILVAEKPIPIGQEITQMNSRWQIWPERALFKDAIVKGKTSEENIMGKKVRRTLTKDEPITPNALIGEQMGSYMAAALNDNMRAIGIKVKPESSVAGFIQPGDYVDVILTYQIKLRAEDSQALEELVIRNAAETILSNIRVLAVDQDADSTDRDAQIGKTITVEVDRRGAEIVALAREMGDIYLSLRKLGDTDDTSAHKNFNPVTDTRIGKILDQALDLKNQTTANSGGIRLYNGENIVNIPVQKPRSEYERQ